MNLDIDHIDPAWKEGRNYQLVCGLDTPLNFCERDEKINQSKSNRFLPWKVSEGEIGTTPVNPGDLCQFLDPDTDDWVLEEFMGEWWYEKTWKTCGPYFGTITGGYPGPLLGRFGSEHPRYGVIEGEETRKKKSEASRGKPKKEEHKKKLRENLKKIAKGRKGKPGKRHTTGSKQKMSEAMRSIRVMCLVTGFTTTPGALTGYQKARGIDPSNRVRIE
jgi:hypothetical protein